MVGHVDDDCILLLETLYNLGYDRVVVEGGVIVMTQHLAPVSYTHLHYGVPVFLFLSAYGLVMKYEAKPHLSTEQQTRMYSISERGIRAHRNGRRTRAGVQAG